VRIIRVKKTNNFTTKLNEVVRRPDLSMAAKGLHDYFMSLPNDWEIYMKELANHFSDGIHKIRKTFNELKDAGYVKIETERVSGKISKWNKIILESLMNQPDSNLPHVEIQHVETPHVVDCTLLSINDLPNTDKILKTNLHNSTQAIFDHWNSSGGIRHRSLDPRTKSKISACLKTYTEAEVKSGITNYATVIKAPAGTYFFTYGAWTLYNFLHRGLDRFVDDAHPLENMRVKEKDVKKQVHISGPTEADVKAERKRMEAEELEKTLTTKPTWWPKGKEWTGRIIPKENE